MKKSMAVRAQSIGLRPCFVRGLRRFAIVWLRYVLAVMASQLLAIIVVPPLSRALHAAGITRTVIDRVSIGSPDQRIGPSALPMIVGISCYYAIFTAPLHCGLVAVVLPALVRGRRRFRRHTMRCSAHPAGWLAPAVTALLLPTVMLDVWIFLPLFYVCAIVIGAIIFLRYRYWGRARRITRMCVHCRYILRGLPDVGRCPECGTRYGLMVDPHSAADKE